ncbi:MAG: single-stranded-DNA-specific exonuclease RecJ [Anaerolineaceae bacterium]|nr:single-stranded-DNA-specific exonuclease RecJ [Anaerolineaceae bacterium]
MSEEVRWIEPEPITIPEDFRRTIGGHPLVAETLWRRGFRTVEAAQAFMDPDAYQPTSADELPDAEIAYERITKSINNRERILIWGDFDVDGQTSTTILVEGLRGLGADVRYHIPIRAKESHGITAEILQEYLDEGFDLLITCDTGITENDNIQTVKDNGIPVVLTDHHTLGETLPPADAVVNPQRLPEDHPLRTLPGVGVVCKLMEGLYTYLEEPFDSGPFYELAALGIVADVALLRDDTRWLLQKGLAHLRHTKRLGLQTLFDNAKINPRQLTETHIGFQIAPRLNAVGRLSDANPVVEFLTTTDPGRARVIGSTIEALNAQRQMITRQVAQAAEKLLQDSPDDRHAPAIVLHYPDWPGGVVGIVANRLVEHFHKPAILLTGKNPFHGSARSVEGINITQAIGSQSKLLLGYGGHPMAAGMALAPENYNKFKRGLFQAVEEQAKAVEHIAEIEINQTITLSEINFDLISEIERLAPFGAGNPPLNLLIRDLEYVSSTEIGQTGDHRKVIAKDQVGNQHQFIWWNGADEPFPPNEFDLVCQLSQSDYRGTAQINAEWMASRPVKTGAAKNPKQELEWVDMRMKPAPTSLLKAILEDEKDVQVWAEVNSPEDLPSVPRQDLSTSEVLVIWTTPPSQRILSEVLRQVTPQKVFVFGIDPGLTDWKGFIKVVAGLVKYVLSKQSGETNLPALASACAAEARSALAALRYWEAKGAFDAALQDDLLLFSQPGTNANLESLKIYENLLQVLLGEMKAFRHFFNSADLHRLDTNR